MEHTFAMDAQDVPRGRRNEQGAVTHAAPPQPPASPRAWWYPRQQLRRQRTALHAQAFAPLALADAAAGSQRRSLSLA